MERYLAVVIALDTFPYPGGGTTCDALYMGVPVVALAGKTRGARFSKSVLTAAGLKELVAEDIESYKEIAVSLAKDIDTLDILHKNLRNMLLRSQLMDVEGYANALEENYKRIIDDYEAGQQ